MKEMNYFIVEEDDGVYNIFYVDDFDDDGYLSGYNGQDGYHMDDYKEQIVFETDSFNDACEYVEKHSK